MLLKSIPKLFLVSSCTALMIVSSACTTTDENESEVEEPFDFSTVPPPEDQTSAEADSSEAVDESSDSIDESSAESSESSEEVAASEEASDYESAVMNDEATSSDEGVEDFSLTGTESTGDEVASEDDVGMDEKVEDYSISDYKPFDPAGIVLRFQFDSAELTPDLKDQLDKIAKGLDQDPLAKIQIHGHADEQGPRGHNDRLSKRRAEAIKRYLVKKGVSDFRLRDLYFGESRPLVKEKSVRAYRQNRRGEFRLDYGDSAFN